MPNTRSVDRLQPLTADASTAVSLLRELLPVDARPPLAAVRHTPVGMFLSVYRGAFTINSGKQAAERVVLEAYARSHGRRELRRKGAPDAGFFTYLDMEENNTIMFSRQHWSMYPDLYRKITQNHVSDLPYPPWDKLEQLLADLYLHTDLFIPEVENEDATFLRTMMYKRLQVWSNLLTLAKSPYVMYMDDMWY